MNKKNLIQEAHDFSKKAHEGQKRKTGEDYFIHPLAVAEIAKKYGADTPTLCACYLHDVVEDTSHTLEEIKEKFGETIAFLVDGVTKTTFDWGTDRKIKKYTLKDKRVILIKMADRLHNITTSICLNSGKFVMKKKKTKKSTEKYLKWGEKAGYTSLANELRKEFEKIKDLLE